MTDAYEAPDETPDVEAEFSISTEYSNLVKQTSAAASQLSAEGFTDQATHELLRTLNTGLAGLLMLAEGQLKATAYLIDLQVEANENLSGLHR